MQDPISKAFAKIKPSAFVKDPHHDVESEFGPEPFEGFYARQLYSVRYAWLAAEGQINPVAAMSDGRVERLYTAHDGETTRGYFDRLHKIARETGATRFFFSRLAATEDQPTDDLAEMSLVWYAEEHRGAERRRVQGLIDFTTGETEEYGNILPPLGTFLHSVLA